MADKSIRAWPTQRAGYRVPDDHPCASMTPIRIDHTAAGIPPRQYPYDQALNKGFDVLRSNPPSPERLLSLGAHRIASTICLTALNRSLSIDVDQREVRIDGCGIARPMWAVLIVHYLCAEEVAPDGREVSFSHFHDCRSYLSVFGKRITGRFLATVGRTAQQYERIGAEQGGRRVAGSGLGYSFWVLPRVPITLIRHEGDEEVAAGASIIYLADAERLLPAEDRVVAAELLLDTLSGKPMADQGGAK